MKNFGKELSLICYCKSLYCLFLSSDVEADNTPAFDAVLKADKKRLALLEEVCLF